MGYGIQDIYTLLAEIMLTWLAVRFISVLAEAFFCQTFPSCATSIA